MFFSPDFGVRPSVTDRSETWTLTRGGLLHGDKVTLNSLARKKGKLSIDSFRFSTAQKGWKGILSKLVYLPRKCLYQKEHELSVLGCYK